MTQTPFPDQRVPFAQVFGYIEDRGSTLTELSARAGISKQALGELVDKLERSGYVRRAPNPHDRRAKLIQTTDKGERQIETSRRVVSVIERRWADVLGKNRMKQFQKMLRELAEVTIKEQTGDATE